jgi:hypothetical protein
LATALSTKTAYDSRVNSRSQSTATKASHNATWIVAREQQLYEQIREQTKPLSKIPIIFQMPGKQFDSGQGAPALLSRSRLDP